jgi:hypothetical protein
MERVCQRKGKPVFFSPRHAPRQARDKLGDLREGEHSRGVMVKNKIVIMQTPRQAPR